MEKERKFPIARITSYNVCYTKLLRKFSIEEKDNQVLLSKIFQFKKISDGGIPVMIIGDELLMGDTPIIENFEQRNNFV